MRLRFIVTKHAAEEGHSVLRTLCPHRAVHLFGSVGSLAIRGRLRSIFLLSTSESNHCISVLTVTIRKVSPERQQLCVGKACSGFGFGFHVFCWSLVNVWEVCACCQCIGGLDIDFMLSFCIVLIFPTRYLFIIIKCAAKEERSLPGVPPQKCLKPRDSSVSAANFVNDTSTSESC